MGPYCYLYEGVKGWAPCCYLYEGVKGWAHTAICTREWRDGPLLLFVRGSEGMGPILLFVRGSEGMGPYCYLYEGVKGWAPCCYLYEGVKGWAHTAICTREWRDGPLLLFVRGSEGMGPILLFVRGSEGVVPHCYLYEGVKRRAHTAICTREWRDGDGEVLLNVLRCQLTY